MGLIIADTSIWIDHIDRPNARLIDLIREDRTPMHPLVVIEISLSMFRRKNFSLLSMI